MIVKVAFLAAIPIYVVIGWFISQNTALASTYDPVAMALFPKMLMAVFAIQVLIGEPIVSRGVMQRSGGYCQPVMIIRLAFYESGAIYGLLLTMMTHDMRYVVGFGLVSLLLILLRVPATMDQGNLPPGR